MILFNFLYSKAIIYLKNLFNLGKKRIISLSSLSSSSSTNFRQQKVQDVDYFSGQENEVWYDTFLNKLEPFESIVEVNMSCPLYSANIVGGKGFRLIQLKQAGFGIPDCMIITSKAFCKVVCDLNVRDKEGLRMRLLGGEGNLVPCDVKTFLENALDPNCGYSIRSSASAEDNLKHSFAGLFHTEMNVKGNDIKKICQSIEKVWASTFSLEVENMKNISGLINEISMSVVIMKQIDCQISGVVLQTNPVGQLSTNTWHVSATQGQCFGIVSGECLVDEYNIDTQTGEILVQSVQEKSEIFELDHVRGGLIKVKNTNTNLSSAPALDLNMTKKIVEEFGTLQMKLFDSSMIPLDVEFCFDKESGKLFILQVRQVGFNFPNKWEASRPGLWRMNRHSSHPLTCIYQDIWKNGMSQGTMYFSSVAGLGFQAVECEIINGFAYFCFRPKGAPLKPPKRVLPPFIMKMLLGYFCKNDIKQAEKFWTDKLHLKFLHEWDTKIKNDLSERNLKIQNVNLKQLDNNELYNHIVDAYENGRFMYLEHVKYSTFVVVPIGRFGLFIEEETKGKVSAQQIVCWTSGHSKLSHGLHGEFPELFAKLSKIPELVKLGESRADFVNCNCDEAEELMTTIHSIIDKHNLSKEFKEMTSRIMFRLTSSYDISSPTLSEQRGLFFNSFFNSIVNCNNSSLSNKPTPSDLLLQEAEENFCKLRSMIDDVETFDSLLDGALKLSKVRDERALFTDIWGLGLLRVAILEAGKRVKENMDKKLNRNLVFEPKLLLDATLEEIKHILLEKSCTVNKKMITTLLQRKLYRETAPGSLIPDFIGGRPIKLTRDHFPNKYYADTVLSTNLAVDEIFKTHDNSVQSVLERTEIAESSRMLAGVPASKGEYYGKAYVHSNTESICSLKKGEILVIKYPSSSLNLLLGSLSAVVTDYGGTLSHAAICARECGIPAVVGTLVATQRIKTGDMIKVDGTNGTVTFI